MGRPREFDQEEALDKAMMVFWQQGYVATSIQDLVDRMGINRGTLYTTFGLKHDLFLAAINRYIDIMVVQRLKVLENPGSVKKAIKTLFKGLVDSAVGEDYGMGCFVTNSATEMLPHDPEVCTRIANSLLLVEKAFIKAIIRGQADGEIAWDKDPRALARYLTSSIQGLRVMSKATPTRAKMQDVANLTLSILE